MNFMFFYDLFDVEKGLYELLGNWFSVYVLLKSESKHITERYTWLKMF